MSFSVLALGQDTCRVKQGSLAQYLPWQVLLLFLLDRQELAIFPRLGISRLMIGHFLKLFEML